MAHTREFKSDLEAVLTRAVPPFVIVQTLAELGAGDPIDRLALVQPAGESGDDVRRDGFTAVCTVRVSGGRDEDEDAADTLAGWIDFTAALLWESDACVTAPAAVSEEVIDEWTIRWIDIDCRDTRNRTVGS